MVKNANLMGGNAVVMMRFRLVRDGQTMSEIVAYGTAVVVERLAGLTHAAHLAVCRGNGGLRDRRGRLAIGNRDAMPFAFWGGAIAAGRVAGAAGDTAAAPQRQAATELSD